MNQDIDILMITYNRAEYTQISLQRLLETCDEAMRVWVWHNGNDSETLKVVRAFQGHPRFYRMYHSHENRKLNEPTNWLWKNSSGAYLSKVDDDCLMPYGWADILRKAHRDVPALGVIGCWRFPEEDFVEELAQKKIKEFPGNHQIMHNCWVEGSGYLMKRQCVDRLGLLREKQSFTNYCIRLAKQGYINGWYYPFLYQEHFDDPRSPHTQLKQDEDMERWAPLSALNNGVVTIDAWVAQLKRSGRLLQEASVDPCVYLGWRQAVRRCRIRFLRMLGIKRQW